MRSSSRVAQAWGVLFPCALFFFVWETSVANPSEFAWMFEYALDPFKYYLSWETYRNSDWHFPFTLNDASLHPIGVTTVLCDIIPWLAALAKLFHAVLPADFNYFGVFLFACYILQGHFARKIFGLFELSGVAQIAGITLVCVSPLFVFRAIHIALSAHFLILWALYLYLRQAREGERPIPTAQLFLVTLIAQWTQPYLFLMVGAIGASILWAARIRATDRRGKRSVERLLILYPLAQIATGWFIGYFEFPTDRGPGYGFLSFDLLGFVNPLDMSSLIPPIRSSPGGYEGLAYLGAGGLLLAATSLALQATGRGRRPALSEWGPLLCVVALLTLYAISTVVWLGGRPILDLSFASDATEPLSRMFRSTGRFVWPLYYLVVVWMVVTPDRALERRTATGVFLAALVAQAVDLGPAYWSFQGDNRFARPLEFEEEKLENVHLPVPPGTEVMAFVPPVIVGACNSKRWKRHEFLPVALSGLRQGLKTNSDFLSAERIGMSVRRELCERWEDAFFGGQLMPNTVYVVHPRFARRIRRLDAAAVRCTPFEGLFLCLSRASAPRGAAARTSPASD